MCEFDQLESLRACSGAIQRFKKMIGSRNSATATAHPIARNEPQLSPVLEEDVARALGRRDTVAICAASPGPSKHSSERAVSSGPAAWGGWGTRRWDRGCLRTVGDDGASLRANFELNQAQPHGRRTSQRHCVRAKAWRCFTSSATYLITAVNGAASGTFTLRASTDSGAVRQLATRRVAVAQSTAQAGATHTRNGSFGSEARIILNFTFSPPPAFGGISARLRRVAFGTRRGATVPAALPLAAGR